MDGKLAVLVCSQSLDNLFVEMDEMLTVVLAATLLMVFDTLPTVDKRVHILVLADMIQLDVDKSVVGSFAMEN